MRVSFLVARLAQVVHLKRYYNPEIRNVGRLKMKLLTKYGIWFTSQQCSETRVSRSGWFVRSHTADGLEEFRAQLAAFWNERDLISPNDQWKISARRVTSSSLSKIETTALWIDCGIPYIDAMANACRTLAPYVTSDCPLLWNTTFVSDKNYH